MQAVRLEGVASIALRDAEKPRAGPGEVLVRVEASGICGTDRHLYHGEFPCRMPVTPGHEFSGIIEALGEGVSGLALGERITVDPNIACGRCGACHAGRVNLCRNLTAIGIHRDGGMAGFSAVPQAQAFRLPQGLDPLNGAFCEPLACCIHGMDVAAVRPGETVAVLGGGVIGLLTVQLARLAGASEIILVTRQKAKRDLALLVGATAALDPGDAGFMAAFREIVPEGAVSVMECAGVVETVEQAPLLARSGGRVVIVGVVAQGLKASFEPFDLLFREVSILTSFLNPFTHRRAAAMIAEGRIHVEPLISRVIGLREAPAAIAAAPRPGEVKVLIAP